MRAPAVNRQSAGSRETTAAHFRRVWRLAELNAPISTSVLLSQAHYQTQPEDIHIIAHGDGTFAADVVGQRIRGIGRISGLNPSGPNFDLLPPELRLDKTDANFVDIIHTDAQNASLSLYRRGTSMSLGHVDFYPNGGLSQPGCNLDDFDDLLKKAVSEGLRTFLSCSHYRAIDYYIESIKEQTQCLHMGYECANYQDFLRGACGHCNDDTHLCAEMGFRSNLYFNQLKREKSSPITMYFNTNKKKPYCRKRRDCLGSANRISRSPFEFFPPFAGEEQKESSVDGKSEHLAVRISFLFFFFLFHPVRLSILDAFSYIPHT